MAPGEALPAQNLDCLIGFDESYCLANELLCPVGRIRRAWKGLLATRCNHNCTCTWWNGIERGNCGTIGLFCLR